MSRTETFQSEKNQQHYWHVKSANGEIVGSSHRGWETAEEAEANLDRIRGLIEVVPENMTAPGQGVQVRTASDDTVAYYRDDAGEHRWQIWDGDDQIGKSSEGFSDRSGAKRNFATFAAAL